MRASLFSNSTTESSRRTPWSRRHRSPASRQTDAQVPFHHRHPRRWASHPRRWGGTASRATFGRVTSTTPAARTTLTAVTTTTDSCWIVKSTHCRKHRMYRPRVNCQFCYTAWGCNLIPRFCKVFSESSPGFRFFLLHHYQINNRPIVWRKSDKLQIYWLKDGTQFTRVANDHDCDQIFEPDCWQQQSIPINFWFNRPHQHDVDIVWQPKF